MLTDCCCQTCDSCPQRGAAVSEEDADDDRHLEAHHTLESGAKRALEEFIVGCDEMLLRRCCWVRAGATEEEEQQAGGSEHGAAAK
jgi:hypothetical protein